MNRTAPSFKLQYLLPLGALSLLTGIWTGLIRLGWNFPFIQNMGDHGALMVGGFVGTLICIERTAVFPGKIALLVPLVNSLSIVFFLIKSPETAYWFLLTGSVGLTVIYFALYAKINEIYLLIMTAGAICYLIGNAILIKTHFYPSAVMWWIAFLYFTILAERLELSRYLNLRTGRKSILIVLLALFIAGILIPFHNSGGVILAVSLIGSAIWLFKYDMAKKSLRMQGQHFYSGLVLLTGYVWLLICGLFMAYGTIGGLLYDPALHAFFLGFVFSMIFAHAPIILPGVLKLQINPFSRVLYLWVVLFQFLLIVRIAGSILLLPDLKIWGGILNGMTILAFLINMGYLVASGKRQNPL